MKLRKQFHSQYHWIKHWEINFTKQVQNTENYKTLPGEIKDDPVRGLQSIVPGPTSRTE